MCMVRKQMGAKLRFDAWSDEDVKKLKLDIEH